jgi:hypothetical protein
MPTIEAVVRRDTRRRYGSQDISRGPPSQFIFSSSIDHPVIRVDRICTFVWTICAAMRPAFMARVDWGVFALVPNFPHVHEGRSGSDSSRGILGDHSYRTRPQNTSFSSVTSSSSIAHTVIPAYRTCTFVVWQCAQRGDWHTGHRLVWILIPDLPHTH